MPDEEDQRKTAEELKEKQKAEKPVYKSRH